MKYKANLIVFGISALFTGWCIGWNAPLPIILFNGIASIFNLIVFISFNYDALVSGEEQ